MRTQTNEQAKEGEIPKSIFEHASFPKSHQSTRKPERLSEDACCFHHGEQKEDRKRAMDMGKFEDGFIEQDSMPLLQASKLAQEPIHERVNSGLTFSATSMTSSEFGSAPSMPHALFETSERPSTRMPT